MSENRTNHSPLPVLITSNHRFSWLVPEWLLRVYYTLFGPQEPRTHGIFMEFGKFIWIQNYNELYQCGSFGKGNLSRSNPTWFARTVEQDKNALEEITVARRKKRRQKGKKTMEECDSKDLLTSTELLELTLHKDVEIFQLDFYEAFFLKYALNALSITDPKQVKRTKRK